MSLHLIEGLWQADYRVILQNVANMGGADLIFTSPPYCDARTYNNAVDWKLEDYQALGDAVFAALKPGGQCLLNLDAPVREWRKGMGSERGFHPWKVMLDWAERIGFRVPDRLAYGRMGQVGKFSGRFRNDWEPLLWFEKPGAKGYVDPSAIAVAAKPYATRKAKSRQKDGTFSHLREKAPPTVRYPGTLWNYGSITRGHDLLALTDTQHPARFSLRLARDVVRVFCPPGGLVCDPFLGSGTTMLASLEFDRRFAGGDAFARMQDDMPWIDVARHVATEHFSQLKLGVV